MLGHQRVDKAEIELRLQLTIKILVRNEVFQAHRWMVLKLFRFASQHESSSTVQILLLIFKERQGELAKKEPEVLDLRGGEWRMRAVESGVIYHISIQGCVE